MYDYLKGILTYINSGVMVVECQGIGFSIFAPESWLIELSGHMHKEITVYTHMVIRESEHALYGFRSRDERECFRILISFSGVGPKTGLAILNRFSLNKLCVIARTEDVKAIASVPGIGKKTAEKLIVDLKQKMQDFSFLELSIPSHSPLNKVSISLEEEGIQALASLGYSKVMAERMIAEAINELPNATSLSEILPIALKKSLLGSNKN